MVFITIPKRFYNFIFYSFPFGIVTDMYPISLIDNDTLDFLLGQIPQPPKQLYIRGTLPPSHKILLTVIGSRRFTSYGSQVLDALIGALAPYPVVIVSGLAFGIDARAHLAALRAGLPTIAIPGSGLEDSAIAPREHLGLAHKILEAGGCLLSEFEPTQPPAPWTFVQRNRLMAGMSRAVLVIEAENKSGTRITAKLATDYNVDVLAVPGSIFSPVSVGTNNLIREGATPITCADDLIAALGFETSSDESLFDKYENCSPEEKKVLDFVAQPIPRSDLIRQLGIPTHKAQVLLSAMEIKGLIKEELGEIRRN
jgi:DNA processing protein